MSDEQENKPSTSRGETADEPAAKETPRRAIDDDDDDIDDETRAAQDKARADAARKRCYKYQDPPKLFDDVKAEEALNELRKCVSSLISEQEIVYLTELDDYVKGKSGSWSVGDEHLTMLASFLANKDNRFPAKDRKEHRLMSYVNLMEQLTLPEQEETVKLLCNMCSAPGSFDWLMYMSEWTDYDGSVTSNSRVTSKAAVDAILLGVPSLREAGVALVFNLSLKSVYDDVASELSTAILQYLHNEMSDDHARLCLTALWRFLEINPSDIAALTKMLGPNLAKFKGKADDIDQLVEKITKRLPEMPDYH